MLLDYIANPPISNSLQGAYFVAAFLPGCILGGASLVFKDLVEGLGCLLGGFCFGMWVMTLKSGGIADSTGARAGVICGLAGAAFSLSFSHHTREPGLIACLSFAGATVIILGIDMFTRAGLTYFWLYIWNLNDELFPLGTHTYPMTRGIKVEIAAIVIIAVCGAMSQMRLWRIIKEKRAKRAEQRQRDEEERAVLDEERNREFTKQHNMDRKQWEREFGEGSANGSVSAFSQSQVDSGMHDSTWQSNSPSLKKLSLSIRDLNQDSIELGEYGPISRRSSQATGSTRRHSKDKPTVMTSSEPLPTEGHRAKQSNPEALKALEKISERPDKTEGASDGESLISGPPGPVVTPLPFKVPTEEEFQEVKEEDEDDVKSLATAGESVAVDEILHAGSKDKGPLAGRKLKRASGPTTGFEIPHVDDARSSVAATLDGVSSYDGSLSAFSRSGTPLPGADAEKPDAGGQYTLHQRNQSAGDLVEKALTQAVNDNADVVDTNRRHSMQLPGDLPASTLGSLANLPKENKVERGPELPAIVATRARSNSDGSASKEVSKPTGLIKEALPEGQSQAVGLYRTNEWAKHQALAETPEYDALAPPSEPGVAVEYGREAAAPVNVAALQQTAWAAGQPKVRKSSSKTPRPEKPEVTRSSSSQSLSRTKSGPAMPVYSSFNSYSSPKRSSSNPNSSSSTPLPPAIRSSSGNLLTQTVPEEESVKPTSSVVRPGSSQQGLRSSAMQSKDNLIKLREDKLKGRVSTMSFAVAGESTSTVNTTGLNSGQASDRAVTPSATQSKAKLTTDEDDVPLAQRRATLKEKRNSGQNTPQHYQLNRSLSNTVPNTSPYSTTISTNNITIDSHQPQRGSTVTPATRESRLASWRASMMQQTSPSQPTFAAPNMKIEANRQQMLESQRKQGEEKARKEMDQRMKQSVMDQKMRSGDIAELHKKKMRQMQRQASQKPGESSQ